MALENINSPCDIFSDYQISPTIKVHISQKVISKLFIYRAKSLEWIPAIKAYKIQLQKLITYYDLTCETFHCLSKETKFI